MTSKFDGPASDEDEEGFGAAQRLREQVRLGCQILAQSGQDDLIWGHLAVRDAAGRGIWIKSAGLGLEEATASDVVLVSPDGELLEGDGRVHLEYPIHTEILASRPDIQASVHTHAEATVTFGATDLTLRPIGHEGTLFVPPEITRYMRTADLIRTPEMGLDLANALGDRNAILMVNHGMVTVGVDVPTAVVTAIMLERACRMQLAARATGAALTWSDDAESLAKRERCYGPHQVAAAWDYLRRRVNRLPT